MALPRHRDQDRCSRAREWASLRLDGELSEIERLLLRRHLSRCDGCRAFAATIDMATRAIRSTPLEAPSRSFAVDRPSARRRSRMRLAAAAGLAVVSAGLGVAVGALVNGSSGTDPTPPSVTEIVDLSPELQPTRPLPVTTVNV